MCALVATATPWCWFLSKGGSALLVILEMPTPQAPGFFWEMVSVPYLVNLIQAKLSLCLKLIRCSSFLGQWLGTFMVSAVKWQQIILGQTDLGVLR